MENKLFASKVFSTILLIVICFEVFGSMMVLEKETEYLSVNILRYFNLVLALLALIFYFVISKHSLSVLKVFIILKLIMIPAYFVFLMIVDIALYLYYPRQPEAFFASSLSLILGFVLLRYYNKFKKSEIAS